MKTSLRPVLTLALLALALAPFAAPLRAAAEKTHTVNLSPMWKAGEKFGLSVTTTMDGMMLVSMALPGQPAQPLQQQPQKRSVRLEADGEVLAAFPNGGLQKATFTVKKFVGSDGGAPDKELLPAGAKVVAEKSSASREKTFTVDGKPAAAALVPFLQMAVELDDAKRTDQEVFGPKSPVAVGATWPVNGDLFAEELRAEMGASLTATGTMRLDSVTGSGDTQVAVVSGAVTLDKIQAPFPPELALKSAEAKAELSGSLPTVHKGTRTQSMKMTMKIVAEGAQEGVTIRANMDMTQQGKSEITYR
jgi:hypothetical protein